MQISMIQILKSKFQIPGKAGKEDLILEIWVLGLFKFVALLYSKLTYTAFSSFP
jgi:hypothetical protein